MSGSVGFKRGEQVYLLETDISFRATPECWSLPGLLSCVFVGEDFMPVDRKLNASPPQQQYHAPPSQHPQHHHAVAPHQPLNSNYLQSLNQQHQHHHDVQQQPRQQQPQLAPYSGRVLSIEEVRLAALLVLCVTSL